jgi:hypothetical protein
MQNEEIDYMSNVYNAGQPFGDIDGNVMLMIMEFLAEVVEKETQYFASLNYATRANEIKDKEGKVIKVDSEWKEHTSESFLMTSADKNGAQLGLTSIGVKSSQILNALLAKHAQNIEKGLTVTKQQRTEIDAFK